MHCKLDISLLTQKGVFSSEQLLIHPEKSVFKYKVVHYIQYTAKLEAEMFSLTQYLQSVKFVLL